MKLSLLPRAYYQSTIQQFAQVTDEQVLGQLSLASDLELDQAQRYAWVDELTVLRKALTGMSGHILLEYSIPRMGKRADAILLFPRVVIVVEFKIGASYHSRTALDQVLDYALDLKNFQKESHDKSIVPVLVATEAADCPVSLHAYPDSVYQPVCTNGSGLGGVLKQIVANVAGNPIAACAWLASAYSPTPTIIEAAQALYRGHGVAEISRSEAGAENLSKTADAIAQIMETARATHSKCICFVTGVPGAGKTLAGLNIANTWHDPERGEHAVFLSGNGPLVTVLREALARDDVARSKERGERKTKAQAMIGVRAFVQNVHHFRDDALSQDTPPAERVAVFDEAQRAWDVRQTAKFMKSRRGIVGFPLSEPHFLVSVMDRHKSWAVIICLVGGGQEINTGEAGLVEWFRVLGSAFRHWNVYIPDSLADSEYFDALSDQILGGIERLHRKSHLHLATSIRSFRAEGVSAFVKAVLDNREQAARRALLTILPTYPIFLTRDLEAAKQWLRDQARGSERYGILASSEAQRLKPFGVNVKVDSDPIDWFLGDKLDVRSSFYLEDVATEFQVQGLEVDWACVGWDADLRYRMEGWQHYRFSGTRWEAIHSEAGRRYLLNAYRVLLTRARQGMVLFVPKGSTADHTRLDQFYDPTFAYLRRLGIPLLPS